MRFEIATEASQPPEKAVTARLRLDTSGNLDLMIDGNFVLTINKDGTAFRHGSISERTGLNLDRERKLILE